MNALPTVFVSHGSPTLALEPGRTGEAWTRLAQEWPRPEAILMVSAHWERPQPAVSAAEQPETIHDFYGFPTELYQIQYPARGTPALAQRVKRLLEAAGLAAKIDPQRGLDHGAWVPLRVMYPDADVPVIQLSVQTRLGPAHHLRLGQALRALPSEGVLVMGSGSLTHNLGEVQRHAGDDQAVPGYVRAFQAWMHDRLTAHDFDSLLDYRRQAPDAVRAHPTEEHLLPLFVPLGAAPEGCGVQHHHDGVTRNVLAMDVYTFS